MAEMLPKGAARVAEAYPELWRAYQDLGEAAAGTGPLSARERRLAKLALAIGAGSQGAVHSHVRRAVEEGIEPAALRQTALLAVTTLGFPQAVAALTWVEDILGQA
ncbi:MAG: carboxymuconolactone decarboxylase family protein [Azospirillaceae bacterium]